MTSTTTKIKDDDKSQPLQMPLQYRGMRDWEDELEFVNTGNNQHQEQLERLGGILALPDDDWADDALHMERVP
jgi:hypothetical protein